jgi:hypothetical protein
MDTDNQIAMKNRHAPPSEGQFWADSEAILANLLINTIASNRKLEILQEEVQKVQEQNANLRIGLQQAYGLIEELRKGLHKQGKTTDLANRNPTNLNSP